MTYQTLQELTDTIRNSKEPIETDLQSDKLIIKTDKNFFWIVLSVIGIALSILLIVTNHRGQYNLEIGLVLLWTSVYGFWRMQAINKTIIIDLRQKTLSIIPTFILQRWFLSKLLKVETTYSFSKLPDFRLLFYTRLKYDWTRRIYFKKGLWTIYLLEFDKKETAQNILDLLKH
ncbi:MAG: hypothetical protein HEQ40_08350 [Lacibacter sp.]|jgi:hypothetical protein